VAVETTYTEARQHLASYFDRAVDDREVIIVRRRKGDDVRDVAIVSAEELESLMEAAHLLSSPRNAQRLLAALSRALEGSEKSGTVEDLRNEVGLGPTPPKRRKRSKPEDSARHA
jgi:antitoxin YefM